MKKKIKHVSELKNWFQIKKYNPVKNLSARGWFEQLCARNIAYAVMSLRRDKLKNGIKNPFEEEFMKRTDNFTNATTIIREDPIVDVINNEKLLNYSFFDSLKEILEQKLYLAFGIRPITARELIQIEKTLDPQLLNLIHACANETIPFDPTEELLDNTIDKLAKEYTAETHSTMRINWCLPDNLLIEHFKQYLTTSRPKEMNDKKKYRSPDFNSWYRLGILPYLDLKIWELEMDISIPNRVIADAIFPNGENGEETIRKTTAVISEGILKGEMLEMLGSYASLEPKKPQQNVTN